LKHIVNTVQDSFPNPVSSPKEISVYARHIRQCRTEGSIWKGILNFIISYNMN